MCKQLFTLCDLQLKAIVADLDRSVETVSDAANKLIQNNSPAAVHAHSVDNAGARHCADELLGDLNKIIIGLQFHDELTQRINHIQVLLKLIQDQSTVVVNPDFDASTMLSTVSRIFSSGAEFNQLGKVFPEYKAANEIDLIEMF
ncbi:MAG: hypothetical protein V4628_04320 [Pseudomonadota bacterium]